MTRTSATPGVIVAGDVAVSDVGELTTTPVARFVGPKRTVAPVTKFVPVIVTDVPPVVGPVFGVTDVTVDTEALYVYESPATTGDVPPAVVTRTSTAPNVIVAGD